MARGSTKVQGQGGYYLNVQCGILCFAFILRETMDVCEGILSPQLFLLIVLGYCL